MFNTGASQPKWYLPVASFVPSALKKTKTSCTAIDDKCHQLEDKTMDWAGFGAQAVIPITSMSFDAAFLLLIVKHQHVY